MNKDYINALWTTSNKIRIIPMPKNPKPPLIRLPLILEKEERELNEKND